MKERVFGTRGGAFIAYFNHRDAGVNQFCGGGLLSGPPAAGLRMQPSASQ